MTIGAIIFPSNSPNLIQRLFKGVKIFEFKIPKIKKIIEIIIKYKFISLFEVKGHNPIAKKTIKKRIPKLLFDDLLCIICKLPINFMLNITLISFM